MSLLKCLTSEVAKGVMWGSKFSLCVERRKEMPVLQYMANLVPRNFCVKPGVPSSITIGQNSHEHCILRK